MNDTIIKLFKYDSLVKFKFNGYFTIDILIHVSKIWERQISTDKEDPGIYRDDIMEYEITKDDDIIILNVF